MDITFRNRLADEAYIKFLIKVHLILHTNSGRNPTTKRENTGNITKIKKDYRESKIQVNLCPSLKAKKF